MQRAIRGDDLFQTFFQLRQPRLRTPRAMLNAQLDRLPELVETLRRNKQKIQSAGAPTDCKPVPSHSPEGECPIRPMYRFRDADSAKCFAEAAEGGVLSETGRHNYTEWDQVLSKQGSHHPDLNPFNMPQNRECRMDYSMDMCDRSLDVLSRTAFIHLDPDPSDDYCQERIDTILAALEEVETS